MVIGYVPVAPLCKINGAGPCGGLGCESGNGEARFVVDGTKALVPNKTSKPPLSLEVKGRV